MDSANLNGAGTGQLELSPEPRQKIVRIVPKPIPKNDPTAIATRRAAPPPDEKGKTAGKTTLANPNKDLTLHLGVRRALESEAAAEEVLSWIGGSGLPFVPYARVDYKVTTIREYLKWSHAEGDNAFRSRINALIGKEDEVFRRLGLTSVPAGRLDLLTPVVEALGEDSGRYAGAMSTNQFNLLSRRVILALTLILPGDRGDLLRNHLKVDVDLKRLGIATKIFAIAGLIPGATPAAELAEPEPREPVSKPTPATTAKTNALVPTSSSLARVEAEAGTPEETERAEELIASFLPHGVDSLNLVDLFTNPAKLNEAQEKLRGEAHSLKLVLGLLKQKLEAVEDTANRIQFLIEFYDGKTPNA